MQQEYEQQISREAGYTDQKTRRACQYQYPGQLRSSTVSRVISWYSADQRQEKKSDRFETSKAVSSPINLRNAIRNLIKICML